MFSKSNNSKDRIPDFPVSMEELAGDIANLRYDALRDLFSALALAVCRDSDIANAVERKNIAWELSDLARCLDTASTYAGNAWDIQHPFNSK